MTTNLHCPTSRTANRGSTQAPLGYESFERRPWQCSLLP
jgi:hypothetical protein